MESRMTNDEDGTKTWRNENGQRHRDNGPAVIWADGSKLWYQNGQKHRDDGPAVIFANGNRFWYQNGQKHREDGPATIFASGIRCWNRNGQLHRDNGPAVIYSDGSVEWWLHDKNFSFTEWADALNLDSKTRLGMVLKWNPE